jgi:thioredoxin-related protein
MEATTFKDPDVVKFMNDKYYCVRFNAERKDDVRFVGKIYHYDPQNKVNELALELMGGHDKLSYPTAIYMEEMFQEPKPAPGYHDVPEMEMITRYIYEGIYKKQSLPDYQKSFKATWK